MGTRLTQFLGSLSSLNRHFTAGMPEKSDKATEATYLFDHYCIGLNLDVCCSQCSRIRWYGLWAFSRPKMNDYWQAENRWLAGVAFPNLLFPINGTFTHISNVYSETLKRPSIKCTERTNSELSAPINITHYYDPFGSIEGTHSTLRLQPTWTAA